MTAIVVGLGVSLGGEDEGTDAPLTSAPSPRGLPEPGRCPPPGPAVVVPGTGETLCGAAARRYIQRDQRERRRRFREMYGPTPAQEREAGRIIAADPELAGLLEDRRYRVARIGPWLAGGKAIGVTAEIAAEPISGTAILPYVCSGDPSAGRGRLRITMRGVTRLLVDVELGPGRVAQVTTAPDRRPNAPPPTVKATPLPGSAKCPKSRD